MFKASFLVILSSTLQRSSPILLGLLVANFYSVEGFADFSYYLVVANTVAAFSSGGVAPSLLSAIPRCNGNRGMENELIHDHAWFLLSVFLLLLLLFIGSLPFLDNPIYNIRYFLGGVGMVLSGFAIVVLQALGRYLESSWFALSVFGSLLISALMMAAIFEYNFFSHAIGFLTFLIGVATLAVLAWLRGIEYSGIPSMYKLKAVFCEINFLFLFNVIRMTSLLVLNSVLLNDVTAVEYSVFSVSYQWFSIIIFIPGILAGVFIPKMSSMSDKRSAKALAYRLSSIYFFVGFLLSIGAHLFYPLISTFYESILSQESKNYFSLMIFGGSIAAATAPIIQYLVGADRGKELLLSSVLWGAVMFTAYLCSDQGLISALKGFVLAYVTLAGYLIFVVERNVK